MEIKTPTDEIREIRHKLAARFDNDIDLIFEDIMRQQRESGRTYITLPRRVPEVVQPPHSVASAEQPLTDPSLPPASPAR